MNPRLLVAAAVVIIVALIAGVAVFAGGGDDDEDAAVASPTVPATATLPGTAAAGATPSPTPTLGTAPTTTPAPAGAEAQARNLELIEAPVGLLEFVTDGPYVVPGDAIGAFYLNVETRQVEGWYALIEGTQFIAFSGEGRFTLFWRKEQVLRGGVTYPAGFYLADRGTRKVYRWEGEAEPAFEKTASDAEIATRGDRVLFRIPGDDGASWFSFFNLASMEVEAAFEAEAQWAFISSDASAIALLGSDVSVAEVATEAVEAVEEDAAPELVGPANFFEPGKWADVELIEASDGSSFVVSANEVDETGAGIEGVWLRLTWAGDLLAQGSGERIFVSADGEFVAVAEAIATNDASVGYYTVSAYQTEDGEPAFRVTGADESFPWPEHDRWLAGGAGVVVQLPGNGVSMAMRDGGLQDFIGVPSPDSPDVFARHIGDNNSFGLVDANGDPLFSVSFQGGVRDFVDPWGDSGEEVRMLIPHGGHDGPPATATIVQPIVEQAPFAEEPAIQLSEVAVAFGLLDLFDEPAGDRVVGQVLDPHRVVVEELVMVCSGNGFSDPERCPQSDSTLPYEFMALVLGTEFGPEVALTSYWARVTTPDGQEGWILLQANVQGI